jgi:hypothetical protein
VSGDNFSFDISSDKREHLNVACALAWYKYKRVVGYSMGVDGELTLHWSEGNKLFVALPYPLDTPDSLHDFVWHWLCGAKYAPKPQIDGHCVKGFRARSAAEDARYVALVVVPTWHFYHK